MLIVITLRSHVLHSGKRKQNKSNVYYCGKICISCCLSLVQLKFIACLHFAIGKFTQKSHVTYFQKFQTWWHGHACRCCPRVGYQKAFLQFRRSQNDVTSNGSHPHLVSMQNKRLCKFTTCYALVSAAHMSGVPSARSQETSASGSGSAINFIGPEREWEHM